MQPSTTNFDVDNTVAKSTVTLTMFVKFSCRLKLNVMKRIFVVIIMVIMSYVLKK